MRRVITFGTFDVFHYGHLRMLDRARELGDYLIVGVSTDELNYSKKDRYPIYSEKERLEIIRGLRAVDEVFYEHTLEDKRQYVLEHKADILVMGDDWLGRFDDLGDVCEVVYLPRTPAISTTAIIEKITS
jgi:glycerol-3-phosphate cytidylyltransferase